MQFEQALMTLLLLAHVPKGLSENQWGPLFMCQHPGSMQPWADSVMGHSNAEVLGSVSDGVCGTR